MTYLSAENLMRLMAVAEATLINEIALSRTGSKSPRVDDRGQ